MKNLFFLFVITLCSVNLQAQYEFKHTSDLECSPIKNQARTGTCWSFATSSFIESELLRMGKGEHNLSEMFVVRNIYMDKARNYVLRQGKANFSQGSLSHDLMRIMKRDGVVPESVYSGLTEDQKAHDHSEMEAGMKGFLDGVIKSKRLSKKWSTALDCILDTYMGDFPASFEYQGKKTTPVALSKDLGLDADNYVGLTSFTHHPLHEKFILEIPDNYSNGSYYNVPLDELMQTIDNAVEKGYTIAWDGDVSEKGFDAKKAIELLMKYPYYVDVDFM